MTARVEGRRCRYYALSLSPEGWTALYEHKVKLIRHLRGTCNVGGYSSHPDEDRPGWTCVYQCFDEMVCGPLEDLLTTLAESGQCLQMEESRQ